MENSTSKLSGNRVMNDVDLLGLTIAAAARQFREDGDLRTMLSIVFAAVDRHEKKSRSVIGRRAARLYHAKGRMLGRWVPYGFRDVGDRMIEPDPDEIAVVTRIVNDYRNGRSPREICDGLNDEGIPCRPGPWNAATIRNIIRRYPEGYYNMPILRSEDGQ